MKKLSFFHALFGALNDGASVLWRGFNRRLGKLAQHHNVSSSGVQGICIRRPLKRRANGGIQFWNVSRRRPVSSLQIPGSEGQAKELSGNA